MTEPVGPGRALLVVVVIFLTTLTVGAVFGFLAAALLPE